MTISQAFPSNELSDFARKNFAELMAADLIDDAVDLNDERQVASCLLRHRYGGPVIAELMDAAIATAKSVVDAAAQRAAE